MKVRLTQIGLKFSDQLAYGIGDELEPRDEHPSVFLEDLVARGQAVLVGDEASPATVEAVAAYLASMSVMQAAVLAMVGAAEAGGVSDARLVVDGMRGLHDPSLTGVLDRLVALERLVEAADLPRQPAPEREVAEPQAEAEVGAAAGEASEPAGPDASAGATVTEPTDTSRALTGVSGEAAAPAAVDPAAPAAVATKKPAGRQAAKKKPPAKA